MGRIAWVGCCNRYLWKPKHRMRVWSFWMESKGMAGEGGGGGGPPRGKYTAGGWGGAQRQSEFSKPSLKLESDGTLMKTLSRWFFHEGETLAHSWQLLSLVG